MQQAIFDAIHRLAGIVHRTPVLTSRSLDEESGGNLLFLKCENFQRTGSFKFRGAYQFVSTLTADARRRGVLTAGPDNQALALALTGRLLDTPVHVLLSDTLSPQTRQTLLAYGAILHFGADDFFSREKEACLMAKEEQWQYVSPWEHKTMLAGHATAAKELIDDAYSLDYLLVPCRHGGLLAGSAAYIKQAHPHCQVIGVQEAVEAAAPLPPSSELTVSLIQRHVDDIMTVSERDVLRAMFYLWSRLKIVVEPAGSLALAPLLAGMLPLSGKRIGLLISGGNIDIGKACNIFKDC